MCGIAGIIGKQDVIDDKRYFDRMLSAVSHRGPDERGVLFKDTFIFGFQRLSITGVDNGHQPMLNESGNIALICNGEIYNHKMLRTELEAKGHVFSSDSDVEVIIHLYEEYHLELHDKIQGQYAFVLQDIDNQKTIMSRDQAGISPLYYCFGEHQKLAVSSEIKALSRVPWIRIAPDKIGLAQALKYWATIPPRTIFEGIKMVPQATSVILDNVAWEVTTYQHEVKNTGILAEKHEDILERVRTEVYDAVSRRVQTDNKIRIGSYLSGGLDSTIITYLASELLGGELTTFSLRFDDSGCDESRYQDICLKHLKGKHINVSISERDLVTNFKKAISHAEFPFFRTAPIPMYLLSKRAAAEGVKVVLSGEGADELFYGYDSYKNTKALSFWKHHMLSDQASEQLAEIYPNENPKMLQKFYRQFVEGIDTPLGPGRIKWRTGEGLFHFFNEQVPEGFYQDEDNYQRVVSEYAKSPLKCCQKIEMDMLLQGYLLSSQGDRMLYANAVEGRYPFLDERVISLANTIPDDFKLFGFNEKYILKAAFKDMIPEAIYNRKKFGYQAPSSLIFIKYMAEEPYIRDLLSKQRIMDVGIFNYEKTQKLIQKLQNMNINRQVQITMRDDLIFMFILGTQAVFSLLQNPDESLI